MLGFGLWQMLAASGGGSSGGVSYDLYVDGASGSDSNDGTSEGQAFATMSRLATALAALSPSATATALVKATTYSGASNSWGPALAAGVTATVSFEEGCIFQGPNDVTTDRSWFNASGSNNYTLELIGLGDPKGASAPRVTGYDAGTGNGLGCDMSGGAHCIVRNFRVDDCVDGWSMHGTNSNMTLYDCVISDSSKSALAHIHTGGQARAFRTDFTGKSGASAGIGVLQGGSGSSQAYYEGCRFIPIANGQVLTIQNSRLVDCEIGTLTASCVINGAASNSIEETFLNVTFDINSTLNMDTCWGLATARHRNNGNWTAANCIFGGRASGSGANSLVFANFNPGSGSPVTVTDCIIQGFTVGLGSGFIATYAEQFVDGPADFDYIWFFDNGTNMDADLVADDGFAAAFTNLNTTETDPQTGSMTTTAKSDWAIGPSSPCIGAGSGGGDIGFQVS